MVNILSMKYFSYGQNIFKDLIHTWFNAFPDKGLLDLTMRHHSGTVWPSKGCSPIVVTHALGVLFLNILHQFSNYSLCWFSWLIWVYHWKHESYREIGISCSYIIDSSFLLKAPRELSSNGVALLFMTQWFPPVKWWDTPHIWPIWTNLSILGSPQIGSTQVLPYAGYPPLLSTLGTGTTTTVSQGTFCGAHHTLYLSKKGINIGLCGNVCYKAFTHDCGHDLSNKMAIDGVWLLLWCALELARVVDN